MKDFGIFFKISFTPLLHLAIRYAPRGWTPSCGASMLL